MKLSKFTKKFVTINSVAMLLSTGVPVLQPQLTGLSTVHAASTDDSGVSKWSDWGTIKWGIDSNGTLWIKPQSGTAGTIGNVYGEILGDTIKRNDTPWFSKAADIKSVRMEGTINAHSCGYLFAGLTNCTDIDVSNLKVDTADSLQAMFAEDVNLQKITGLDKFNTSNVTDMYGMFQDCKLLTDDIISNIVKWNTSKVTDMTYMFWNCKALTSIPVGNWKTSSVTKFNFTFDNCSNLKTLDVSKWDTSKATSMEYMFTNCSSLTNLDVSNWNTSNVTDMSDMFQDCSNLTNLDVSKWDTGKVTDISWMFHTCSSLDNLDISNWNTSNVTNMSALFTGCKALTDLDVSDWNTSKVTNMSYLFNGCSGLTDLNVSKWDTSAVTTMYGMFTNCTALTNLPVGNWNTSKVTSMYWMFSYCSNLANLNVSKWDTSAVTDMEYMFNSCSNLVDLDVSNWDTNKVTDMGGIFTGCKALTDLDLSNWNTSAATDMSYIFANCSKLSKLKLGKKFTIPGGQDTYLSDPSKTGEYTGRWSKADGSNGMSAIEMLNLTGKEHDSTGKSLDKTLTQEDRAGTWVWERGYTVTLDPNGGSGSTKTYVAALSQNQTYGTDSASIYISDPGYTRKGYKSDGANEKKDGTGTKYQYPFTLKTNSNKTIYAQWKFNGFKIFYHANGGTGTMSDTTLAKGDAVSLTSNSFTRSGYTFDGWNTSAQGTGTSYSNSQTITPDSNMNLYAQWKGIPYKIKFDANTGSGSMDDESLVYGTSKAISKNTFTKKSYVFTGWNTKADGTGTKFTDQQKVSNLSTSGQTITLYAQWRKANWNSSGTDITKTEDNAVHEAGTYVLTIPTKISKTGMPVGNVDESITYDVNVTGNIPKNSYVHVSAAPSDGLVGSNGTLDLNLTQGKKIWSEDDAYGTVNPDGSLSGSTTSDTVTITGTAKSVEQYTGLVTYSAVMNESGKDPISTKTSWGSFSISSQGKKAVETYEDSNQLGFTAGTKLHSDLTGTQYQWSINGKNIPGAINADYAVTDADLKTGETDGKFQSNKLECTVTKADGTKETAYVYLAVPLTYSSTVNVDLKRTLTDNGNIAYEGYTLSNGANVGYGYTNCGWKVPASATSFKATDKFMPSQMFMFAYGAKNLETFDATNIDTSQVTNMQDLFYGCSKIQTLDVSGWDVSKVSDNFILAFGSMTSLKTLKGIENWDTQSAINMQSMFFMDSNLSADLSGWNVSKVNINLNFNYGANKVIAPKWHG